MFSISEKICCSLRGRESLSSHLISILLNVSQILPIFAKYDTHCSVQYIHTISDSSYIIKTVLCRSLNLDSDDVFIPIQACK